MNNMGIGDWGLGIWGLGGGEVVVGIGPQPHSPIPKSPIPNPQSPIPNPHIIQIKYYINIIYL